MVIDDTFFMELAINEAWKFQLLTYPNPTVGCCIVNDDDSLLALRAHEKVGFGHAEVLALLDAYIKLTGDKRALALSSSHDMHKFLLVNHNDCFIGCTIYVTLEPCAHIGKTPSCAMLISKLGVKRVVIATRDITKKAKNGIEILSKNGVLTQLLPLKKQAEDLLYPFKLWNKTGFVFFKLAHRINGTIDGGVITSLKSRELVHTMRSMCDLIVVGGNTVRRDRPILDARLVGGRAPDVLIISKSKNFDSDIPLFNIPNRKVMIENNFELLKNYRLIMIEGGPYMFEFSKPYVDYYLDFIAPSCENGMLFGGIKTDFRFLHVRKYFEDTLIWMKPTKG